MPLRHAQVIDSDTGELLQTVSVPDTHRLASFPLPENRKYKRPPFVAVYTDNIMDIIEKKHLTSSEAGVLLFMLPFLDWQGTSLVDRVTKAPLNESTLAEKLGMERRHVWEVLRTLNDKGMVFLINKGKGHPSGIMLNPNLFFFGKAIKDPTEQAHFEDCAYEPKKRVYYRKSTKD